MSAPDRIAMCVAEHGENLHIPLAPGEPCPTSCFQDCDCTPVEFVRVALPEDVDPEDPFGIALIGETVGHCSKCGERREALYTCRDGGETVPLAASPTSLPEEGDR